MATNTTVVGTRVAKPKAAAGPWREAAGRLLKNKLAVVGLVIVILFLFCGIFGPLIAPWPYQVQDLPAVLANGNRPLPPLSPNHILGTDQLGRDLLSRLLDGARISVTVALRRPGRHHPASASRSAPSPAGSAAGPTTS